MDIDSYITSGVLESYCLGIATGKEREQVEEYLKIYPEIREELSAINDALELYALENGMRPRAATKIRLLSALYEQEAGVGKKYPPLIRPDTAAADLMNWIRADETSTDHEPVDDLAIVDLPSTAAVTNFMVWAKKGHAEEVHDAYVEFIVILKGHCDMYFNGAKKHYDTGSIIIIPPDIPHRAVVTSDEPMVALVQRQLIAA